MAVGRGRRRTGDQAGHVRCPSSAVTGCPQDLVRAGQRLARRPSSSNTCSTTCTSLSRPTAERARPTPGATTTPFPAPGQHPPPLRKRGGRTSSSLLCESRWRTAGCCSTCFVRSSRPSERRRRCALAGWSTSAGPAPLRTTARTPRSASAHGRLPRRPGAAAGRPRARPGPGAADHHRHRAHPTTPTGQVLVTHPGGLTDDDPPPGRSDGPPPGVAPPADDPPPF